ncbi:putative hydrophobin SC1 [Chiua virens]|nr:putative hydrophobin SC1 [Chiua virens]
MRVRFSTLFPIAALVAAVTAIPTYGGDSQCNTGSLSCCDSTYSNTDTHIINVAEKLALALPDSDIAGLVGVKCTPIALGTGSGASCTQQTVCCAETTYNGLVNLGCTPANINA